MIVKIELKRNDLISCAKDKAIEDINAYDFNVKTELIELADKIVFIENSGYRKTLKNR